MYETVAQTSLKLVTKRLNEIESTIQVLVAALAKQGSKLDDAMKEKKNLLKAKDELQEIINSGDDLSCGNCCCDGVCA